MEKKKMKKIIMALLFALAAGVCFGEIRVFVKPITSSPNSTPLIEPETLTRLLKSSVVKFGYTVVDSEEENADFIISGSVSSGFFALITKDVKTGEQLHYKNSSIALIELKKDEEANKKNINNYIITMLGSSARSENQREFAKWKDEKWKDHDIYMSTGAGGGFSFGGAFSPDGESSVGGGIFGGSVQFDFGGLFKESEINKKGKSVTSDIVFGTGLTFSFFDGNSFFWIPLELRFPTRYERTELSLGLGGGIGFGSGSFSVGFCTRGSIGWKAGPGIIFLEAQFNGTFNQTGKNAAAFGGSGLLILGYKFGWDFW